MGLRGSPHPLLGKPLPLPGSQEDGRRKTGSVCERENDRGGESESGVTCLNVPARSQEQVLEEEEERRPLFPWAGVQVIVEQA